MSSVFDILLKSREIEGIREMLTSGDLIQQLCGLFFRGNHLVRAFRGLYCCKVGGNYPHVCGLPRFKDWGET